MLGLKRQVILHGLAANPIELVTVGDSITNSYTDPGYYTAALQGLVETRQGRPVNLTRLGAGGISWEYPFGGNPKLNTYIANNLSKFTANAKIVLFAGTNGLKLGGKTPAQEYADFEAGLGLILGAGATPANIVVVTMLPRETYSEANRTSYNNLLVAGAATYGYKVAKLHLNTDVGLTGQQNSAYWYIDQIHPTTNACDQIARIVYDQIYSDFIDAFNPVTDLPNYWNHWDAQVSGSITQSGGRVSQWAARGSTMPLTQGTSGNQPAYNATGINGLPAIEFDGGSRRAWLQNTSITFATKPMAFWMVAEWDDYTTANSVAWVLSTDNTTWESCVRFGTGTDGRLNFTDALNSGVCYYTGGASLDPMLLSGRISTLGATHAPSQAIWKDGANGAIGSTSLTQLNATVLRVGCPVLDIWRMRGKIGEIGFVQGELNAYWHQLLAKKLAAKWGMSAPNVP